MNPKHVANPHFQTLTCPHASPQIRANPHKPAHPVAPAQLLHAKNNNTRTVHDTNQFRKLRKPCWLGWRFQSCQSRKKTGSAKKNKPLTWTSIQISSWNVWNKLYSMHEVIKQKLPESTATQWAPCFILYVPAHFKCEATTTAHLQT